MRERTLSYSWEREMKSIIKLEPGVLLERRKELFHGKFIFVDTKIKLYWDKLIRNFPHHPVYGGEISKSVGTAVELYPIIDEHATKVEEFVVIGGGAVIDTVGYAVTTTQSNKLLMVIPSTLSSMMMGFFQNKFFLNFDWKKDRVYVEGVPTSILIDPTLSSTEDKRNVYGAMTIAICNAASYDSALFDYMKKNLFSMPLEDMVWSVFKLRAAAHACNAPLPLGENLVGYVQESTGLRMDYPIAYTIAAVVELEMAYKGGYLSLKDYTRIREILARLRVDKRIPLDYSHLIEVFERRSKGVKISVLTGIGSMTSLKMEPHTFRELLIDAMERGITLMG